MIKKILEKVGLLFLIEQLKLSFLKKPEEYVENPDALLVKGDHSETAYMRNLPALSEEEIEGNFVFPLSKKDIYHISNGTYKSHKYQGDCKYYKPVSKKIIKKLL